MNDRAQEVTGLVVWILASGAISLAIGLAGLLWGLRTIARRRRAASMRAAGYPDTTSTLTTAATSMPATSSMSAREERGELVVVWAITWTIHLILTARRHLIGAATLTLTAVTTVVATRHSLVAAAALVAVVALATTVARLLVPGFRNRWDTAAGAWGRELRLRNRWTTWCRAVGGPAPRLTRVTHDHHGREVLHLRLADGTQPDIDDDTLAGIAIALHARAVTATPLIGPRLQLTLTPPHTTTTAPATSRVRVATIHQLPRKANA